MPRKNQRIISSLARNSAELLQPDRLGKLLGCGEYGCVFSTSDPTKVFKIGSQKSEYWAASKLLKEGLTHPGLPKLYNLSSLPDGFYGLIRENIPDIKLTSPAWFNTAMADLEHDCEDPDHCDEFVESATAILGRMPGTLQDELLFEQFVDLAIWGYHHQIVFGDLHFDNFGQRDGQLVLRDLGGSYSRPETR